jgi:hypothetical protein
LAWLSAAIGSERPLRSRLHRFLFKGFLRIEGSKPIKSEGPFEAKKKLGGPMKMIRMVAVAALLAFFGLGLSVANAAAGTGAKPTLSSTFADGEDYVGPYYGGGWHHHHWGR